MATIRHEKGGKWCVGMRLIYLLLLVFVMGQSSIVSAVSVSARATPLTGVEIASVKASHLNVRTGPGTNFHIVRSLPKGTQVTLLDPRQDGVAPDDETWSKITAIVDGMTIVGWVCDRYLEDKNAEPAEAPTTLQSGADDPTSAAPVIASPPSSPETILTPTAPPATGSSKPLTGTPKDPVIPNLPDVVATPLKPVQRNASVVEPEEKIAATEPAAPERAEQGLTQEVVRPLTAPEAVETRVVAPPNPLPDVLDKSAFTSAPDSRPASSAVIGLPTPVGVPSADELNIPEAPIAEAAAPSSQMDPLSYETVTFSCRRGFFFAGIESCDADIRVSLALPPEFLAFAGSVIPVTCDTTFAYTVGNEVAERLEVFTQQFEVELVDGQGERVISERIDFAFRLNSVRDVRLADTSCIAGK